MALDQTTRTFLAGIAAAGGPPLHEMPLADVRTLVRTLHQQLGGQPTGVANVREEPLPVDGGAIPIRMYWPRADAERPLPIIIHYHGGGWAAGDLDSHDVTARYLCRHADAWVIHVGYRLA